MYVVNPFRSKAQQRYFFAAEARGELPKGTAMRWAHETKNTNRLPEYAGTGLGATEQPSGLTLIAVGVLLFAAGWLMRGSA